VCPARQDRRCLLSALTAVQPDSWCGCYPALVSLPRPGAAPSTVDGCDAQLGTTVAAVWATTSEEDRQGFHQFTCYNSRHPDHVAAVDRVLLRIRACDGG
jgi:hypothetical protein